jgi:hypothetical protein
VSADKKHLSRAPESVREEVEVLISDEGRMQLWGRHEILVALYKDIGEKEFPEASLYCG